MKKKVFLILFLIGMTIVNLVSTDLKSVVIKYEGNNYDIIKKIYCKLGMAVTFKLPKNATITDFAIGDPKFWKAESNGRFGMVRPLIEQGHQTTLAILTSNQNLFIFQLIEITGSLDIKKCHGLVVIKNMNEKYFKSNYKKKIIDKNNVVKKKAEREAKKKKEKNLTSLDYENIIYNYKVKDRYFKIENVLSDGVVTYVYHPKLKDVPAFFLNNGLDDKLTILKVVPRNGLSIIHHSLEKYEKFILKSDKKLSTIRLK